MTDDYEILDFLSKEQVDRLREMGLLNETKLRDLRIKRDFQKMKQQGMPSGVALRVLATQYYRSAKTIEHVVYEKNGP